AAAAAVAGMLADSSSGGRKRVVENHREECLLELPFFIELKKARNVHVQRATVLAGRQGEFLADARDTAVGEDVVLEFVAEMSQGSEDRIGRSLAKSAERTITDKAAEFIEQFDVVRRSCAFGHAIQ